MLIIALIILAFNLHKVADKLGIEAYKEIRYNLVGLNLVGVIATFALWVMFG